MKALSDQNLIFLKLEINLAYWKGDSPPEKSLFLNIVVFFIEKRQWLIHLEYQSVKLRKKLTKIQTK